MNLGMPLAVVLIYIGEWGSLLGLECRVYGVAV